MFIKRMLVDKLIEGCLEGKESHFSELYDLYSSNLYGICLRYAGDEDEAKDILQEGFVKVFQQLRTFDRKKGSLEGWLKRIFINLSIDYYRKKPGHYNTIPVESICDEIPDDVDDSLPDLSYDQLIKMIHELPPGYRMVFNLYAIDNKKHKDIASMMNITENTSKTQLLKARKMLQRKISEVLLTSQSNTP